MAGTTLIMNVARAGANSRRPGEKVNELHLTLPPKSDRVDDDNAGVFPDATRKSASVAVSGVSDEVLAAFEAGKRARVTIEILP